MMSEKMGRDHGCAVSNVLNHAPCVSVDQFEHARFLSNQENWHDGIDATVDHWPLIGDARSDCRKRREIAVR